MVAFAFPFGGQMQDQLACHGAAFGADLGGHLGQTAVQSVDDLPQGRGGQGLLDHHQMQRGVGRGTHRERTSGLTTLIGAPFA